MAIALNEDAGTNNNTAAGTNKNNNNNPSPAASSVPPTPAQSVAASAGTDATAEELRVEDIIKQLQASDDISKCLLCLYLLTRYKGLIP